MDPSFSPPMEDLSRFYQECSTEETAQRTARFRELMNRRRTVRVFSPREVPRSTIEDCLAAAATAPSGANQQPWQFVAVSDPDLKRQIRLGAEAEEKEFYRGRAPAEWLEALALLGTDEHKPFLEIAPWLVAIFVQRHHERADGTVIKHYYPMESVGIATGFLIAAIHQAGLVALTHTPSPMNFLNAILHRPPNEKPFLLLPVGYPATGAQVPAIRRKPLSEVITFL